MSEVKSGAHMAGEELRAGHHRPDIQALRAVAVLLVVLYHLWPEHVSGGFVGVDVFFVISGFLITDLLLRSTLLAGGVPLLQFWTRRAFRLLPAALTVILVTGVLSFILVSEHEWQRFLREGLSSTFYVQNWALVSSESKYLTADAPPTAFQHFWSLSIEEQFYFFLPLALLAIVKMARKSKWQRNFIVSVCVVTVASFAWSVYLSGSNETQAYFGTPARAWEFGLGSVLALLAPKLRRRLPAWSAWVGAGMILAASVVFDETTTFPGFSALLPTVGAAVWLSTVNQDRIFSWIMGSRPVQFVGDASYSIYLWHWPLIVLTERWLGKSLSGGGKFVLLGVVLLVSWASLRWIENPFRARGRVVWKSPSGAFISAGVAASLVLGLTGLAVLDRRIAASNEALDRVLEAKGSGRCFGAPALHAEGCPPADALLPAVAQIPKDDGMRPACWGEPGDGRVHRCTVSNPENPRLNVLAVGDSHTASLIPAYERVGELNGWRIDVTTRAGCYLTSAKVAMPPMDKGACKAWQSRVMRQIVSDPSLDAVIVTRNETMPIPGPSKKVMTSRTEDGLEGAWREIVRSGKRVVVLEDVPNVSDGTIACVSKHGLQAEQKCSVERDKMYPKYSESRTVAGRVPRATHVPVEDLFCRESSCRTVIGGVAVFRNSGHVTRTFSKTLGPLLAPRIARAAFSGDE